MKEHDDGYGNRKRHMGYHPTLKKPITVILDHIQIQVAQKRIGKKDIR